MRPSRPFFESHAARKSLWVWDPWTRKRFSSTLSASKLIILRQDNLMCETKKEILIWKKKKTKNAKSRNEILPSFFCPNFPIAKMLRVLSLDWESLLAPYDDLTLLQKSSSSWASPEVEKIQLPRDWKTSLGRCLPGWLASDAQQVCAEAWFATPIGRLLQLGLVRWGATCVELLFTQFTLRLSRDFYN